MIRPPRTASYLLLLALTLPLLSAADAPPIARIGSIAGSAPVKVTDLGKAATASVGMELHDGFALETGTDTRLTLVFRDGNVRFVGRNARMNWKSAVPPAGPSAANTADVLAQILSDGAPDIFRNVVTGAAMASRPEPRRRVAAQPKPDEPAGPADAGMPLPEASGGGAPAAASAPAPAPLPAPPTQTPGQAAVPETEGVIMEKDSFVAAETKKSVPEFETKSEGALESLTPEETGTTAGTAADACDKSADLAPQPAQQRLAKGKEAPPYPTGAADGWRAGRGFVPAGGSHLSLKYGKFVAPELPNAVVYTLELFAKEAPGKPLHAREGKRPEFAVQGVPMLKPGAVYEWRMTARDAKGRTLVSARLPFAAFDEATERSLAECLRVIDTLPKTVDPGAKLLLRARAFARYRLVHLALREAEKAKKSKDEAIRTEAEALLSHLIRR